jgi:parallel beta-helix repeat protein
MSYARFDDEHENGRLSELCARLSGEVQMQLGEKFSIFQDRNDISWGQQWKQRIEDAIDATTFLIPILTPGFFRSPACRSEVERFLEREKRLRRSDLILPIYYVNCSDLSDGASSEISTIIAARQYADWRELRFESFGAPSMGKTLATLASQIVRATDHIHPPRRAGHRMRSVEHAVVYQRSADGGAQIESAPSVNSTPNSHQGKKDPPTLIVDAFHRGDHSSISDAMAVAQSGYRLVVRPGLYRENIVINKVVEIIGDGELGEVVLESDKGSVIKFQASMGRVTNLTLRHTGPETSASVDILQGRLDLEGCDITSLGTAGVVVRGGSDPRLRRNRLHNCTNVAVYFVSNALGTVEDNDIFESQFGCAIRSGSNPTLRRNRIRDCEKGVFIDEGGRGTIEDSDIFSSANSGVQIKSGGNPTLRRNRIYNGKAWGIRIDDNGLGMIEDNDIYSNEIAGVQVSTGGNPTVRGNRIHSSRQAGILVHESGLGTFEDNNIARNAYAGVEIRSGGNPKIRGNTIRKNGQAAVWVHTKGCGEIVQNDFRESVRGLDIGRGCKATVRAEGNKEVPKKNTRPARKTPGHRKLAKK